MCITKLKSLINSFIEVFDIGTKGYFCNPKWHMVIIACSV